MTFNQFARNHVPSGSGTHKSRMKWPKPRGYTAPGKEYKEYHLVMWLINQKRNKEALELYYSLREKGVSF